MADVMARPPAAVQHAATPKLVTEDTMADDTHDTETEEVEGSNIRQIVAVAILLAALLGGGLWLTGALRSTSAIQDCAMSGRSNCAPIKG
jgi:hypothetical protein